MTLERLHRLSLPLLFGSMLVCSGFAAQHPKPQRIISLVPAVTEMLFVIGAGPQVTGVSSFDRHPAEVEALPRVGGLLDPDMERILSLRPDLVIVYATQDDARQQLERATISIFSYRHGGLSHVTDTIRALGDRTGHESDAGRVAAAIEGELASIRQRVRGRRPPRTMLVFGREPGTLRNLYASGGAGFLHDMLEAAGGVNVFADIRRESVQPTMETVISIAPEVIIELRYDETMSAPEIDREKQAWRPLSSVPAVRRGRLHILTGSEFVVPGPRVAAATARLARALHADAF